MYQRHILTLPEHLIKILKFLDNLLGVDHASNTAQKMKFSIKDFFSKGDQIRGFLRIWSHLLKKSLMENFMFCAVESCIVCVYYERSLALRLIDVHYLQECLIFEILIGA